MKKIVKVILFITSVIAEGCGQSKKEIFILPKDFTGYIMILYDQNSGVPIKIENDKRVHQIPENGILITQSSIDAGWMEFPEFYYEKVDSSSQIPFKIDYNDIPVDSVVAFGGTSGAANKDLAGKEVVRFTKYFVGNKSQIDSAYQKVEKLDILKLAD